MRKSTQAEENSAAQSVTHWRTLRERFESRMRGLEGELRDHRWDRAEGVTDAIAIERRYERLLRLRRLHAKVVTRERLAAL